MSNREIRELLESIDSRLHTVEQNLALLVTAWQDQGLRISSLERRTTPVPLPKRARAVDVEED